MIFKRGDLCWIAEREIIKREYRGLECIVDSPLRQIRGEARHVVIVCAPGGEIRATVKPENLIKQPPPDTRLESWDQSPFRPKALVRH